MKNRTKRKNTEKRNKIIFGLITIFIMVSGGVAMFADSIGSSSEYDYNDFKFELENQMWKTQIDDQETIFISHPTDVDYLSLPTEIKDLFSEDKGVYITSTPEEFAYIDEVKGYLNSHLYYDFGIPALLATTSSNETEMNYEDLDKEIIDDLNLTENSDVFSQQNVITCENATVDNPVVYFKYSQNMGFDYKENCAILMAPSDLGLMRLVDRLLFSLHGIIQ